MPGKSLFYNTISNGKPLFPNTIVINKDITTLYAQIAIINGLLINYENGEFNNIIDFINNKDDIRMANIINTLKITSTQYPFIEQLKALLINILSDFTQIVNQYNNSSVLVSDVLFYKSYYNAFTNAEQLQNYLDILNTQVDTPILEPINITGMSVPVKPEIRIYIQRYGLPKNGIFDVSKLADILDELNIVI